MRILVTGSNGLLGQKLVHALRVRTDVELIATSIGANRVPETEGYSYASLDITNRQQVLDAVAEHRPNVLINTAAMTHVDKCVADKEGCWKLNVTAVEHLVEACEANNVHLLHLSTDFIFDGEAGPYRETDGPNPVSYYGESKLAAERVVEKAQCSWAIARTVLVYGVTESMSRSNVVLWAKGALEKGEPIRVVNDQFRTPTLSEDLAAGCIQIAEQKATGIYHLSGKDFMSVLELVQRVADHFGLDASIATPISSEALNQPAKRPPITGFVLDKARTELGYAPRNFEEGLDVVARQVERLQQNN